MDQYKQKSDQIRLECRRYCWVGMQWLARSCCHFHWGWLIYGLQGAWSECAKTKILWSSAALQNFLLISFNLISFNKYWCQNMKLNEQKQYEADDPLKAITENPWGQLSQDLQNLFTIQPNIQLSNNAQLIKLFQIKPTNTNFCTLFFEGAQNYYLCKQCDGDKKPMRFCRQCFDFNKHIGHNYALHSDYSSQSYCECGRKSEPSCKRHQSPDDIEVSQNEDLTQEQKGKFLLYFSQLMELAIYYEETQPNFYKLLLEELIDTLIVLNQSSAPYNRLTADLFEKQLNSLKDRSQEMRTILYPLQLNHHTKTFQLITHIFGDRVAAKKVSRMVAKNEQIYNSSFDNFIHAFHQNLSDSSDSTILGDLANEGLFFQFYPDCYKKLQGTDRKGEGILQKFAIHSLQKKMSEISPSQNPFARFNALKIVLEELQIKNYQQNEIFIVLALKLFPNFEQVIGPGSKGGKQFWQSFEIGNNTYNENEGKFQQVDLELVKIVLQSMLVNRDVDDFREWIQEKGLSQKFQFFLKVALTQIRNICGKSQSGNAIFALILLSSEEEQAVRIIWGSILNLQQQKSNILNNVHTLMASILRIQEYYRLRTRFQYENFIKQRASCNFVAQHAKDQLEFLQNWFRSYLYECKQVRRQKIIHMKNQCYIQFESAGAILNDLCSYDDGSEAFRYSSSKNYSSLLVKFSMGLEVRDFFNTSLELTEIDRKQIEGGKSLRIKLFGNVFEQEYILGKLKELEILKDPQSHSYSFFMLKVIDEILQGKNRAIHSEIEIDQEIYSLPPKQDRSQKRKKRKNKMDVKFKKMQASVLQRHLSQSESMEQDDTCIICHEHNKIDNQFVYLSAITTATISNRIHGDEDKASIQIATCFHLIHIRCFIQLDSNIKVRECPLCSKRVNIVVPISYDRSNKKLNKICLNIMISQMVQKYKIYDIESGFILFFKHIVESKGLNALAYLPRFQQNSDDFVLKILENIYESANEYERVSFGQEIGELLRQIQACSKESIRDVQRLMAYALRDRLQKKQDFQEEIKLLINLKKTIKKEQFLIVEQKTQEITHKAIVLPQIQMEEGDEPKESLSLSITRPPEKVSDFPQFFNLNTNSKCQDCKQQCRAAGICLLCNGKLCANCLHQCTSGHLTKHNNLGIFLQLQTACAYFYNSENINKVNIYFNKFRVEYSSCYRLNVSREEDYELDDIKFSKAIYEMLRM